ELHALDYESTKLLADEEQLLRIDSTVQIAGATIKSVVWTDDRGQALKTEVPGLRHQSFRTTREIALRPRDDRAFDLGEGTIVKVSPPLHSPHATRRVVYRAALASGDPSKSFVSSPTQLVRRIDDHTAEITVRAIRPETPPDDSFPATVSPTDADLQPNNLIQSDDAEIVKLAKAIAAEEADQAKVAVQLEQYVRGFVHNKNFTQAISSAADVVRSREGDCTEHAVLLAALCRARGIPARVAIGLVYYEPQQGFAYHMWNEIWIGQQWIPLDATLGQGGIGAAHLKVSDSNLSSASPITALLPVVEVMGQLELEIVSAE
ncbi:MAG TPA: transglutaminase-like domain-containing protein, partial [Nitrospiraceae bacterium]|nr:transglutaminase-like domain-containing protein [Nitrospiraceae bacterium]